MAGEPPADWLEYVAAALDVVVPGLTWSEDVERLTDEQRADVARVLDAMLRERSLEDSTPR